MLFHRHGVDPAETERRDPVTEVHGGSKSHLFRCFQVLCRRQKKDPGCWNSGNGASPWCCGALTGAWKQHHLKTQLIPRWDLGNQARDCWSNTLEVVWLSCFSAQRSVSTKHWQGWLRPREAEVILRRNLTLRSWGSPGAWRFLKINLIHPLRPITLLTQLKRSHITVPEQKKSYYRGESCPGSKWH